MTPPADPLVALAAVEIDLLRCPRHGVKCLAINDTRITGSKCCGSWDTERKFVADLINGDPLPVISLLVNVAEAAKPFGEAWDSTPDRELSTYNVKLRTALAALAAAGSV